MFAPLFARTGVSVGAGNSLYLTAVALSLGCSIPLVSALMPTIVTESEISEFVAGVIQSIFFLGHISGIFIGYRLLGRWTTQRLCGLASAATAAGLFVCAAGGVPGLLVGRVLAGFGLSVSVILVSSILVKQEPQRASSRLCVFHAAIAASAALTLFLAPFVAEQIGSWQVVVVASAIACSGSLLTLLAVDLPELKSNAETKKSPTSTFHEKGTVVSLALIVCAYVSTEQIVTGFLPLVLSAQESATTAGSITALFWMGVIGGRLVGLLPKHVASEQSVLITGCMLMTAALGLISFVSSTWAVGVAAFLAGFGGGPLVPIGFGLASRTASDSASAIFTCQSACFIGGFFGPSLAGAVADRVGLSPSLLSCFGLAPAIVCTLFVAMQFAQRSIHWQMPKFVGLSAK